ncbi:MAG: Hsp20/alpha crystallin family protein [Chloroflexi bacterium]|nr:Hsp20/alpha crystallin family protein [Chloroflexota bacterium]
MLDRRDAPGRMLSLRQLMDRLFEDAFVVPQDLMSRVSGAPAGGTMDVYEEGDDLVVEAQLPGMKPDDVDVQVERGMLMIRGQTSTNEERKERNYLIHEQRSGSFSRTLQLPDNIDVDACRATFENGVLRLVFPKTERARPRRIQVTGGRGQPAVDSGHPGGSQSDGPSAESAGQSSGGQAGGTSSGQAG